jgi:hypothetical protein
MDEIVILCHAEDLEVLRASRPDLLERAELFTPSPYLCLELEETLPGLRVISEGFSKEQAYAFYARACEESHRACADFPTTPGEPGLDLARFFRFYLTEPLHNLLALWSFVENEAAGRLVHYVRRPMRRPQSRADLVLGQFVLDQVLRARETAGVAAGLAAPPLLGSTARAAFLESLSRDLTRLRRWIRPARGGPDPGPRTIALGSGYDALTVIPDTLRLAEETGKPPLFLMNWIDTSTTRAGLRWRPEYEAVERWSLTDLFRRHPAPPLSLAERRACRHAMGELLRRLQGVPPFAACDFAPALAGLAREMETILWLGKAFCRILPLFRGSDVVLTHLQGIDEKILEQLSPRFDLTLHARPHGWLAVAEDYEFAAHEIYCDGPLGARLFREVLGQDRAVRILPAPHLLELRRERLAMPPDERKRIVSEARSRLGLAPGPIILLLTTGAKRHLLNDFRRQALHDAWAEIFSFLRANPGVNLLVKSHPNNFDAWVRARAQSEGVPRITFLDGRLEDALLLADLAVEFGKPGTATLATLLLDVPMLVFRNLYAYLREFGDMVHGLAADCAADTPQELATRLEGFIANAEKTTAELRQSNKNLLNQLVEL